MNNIISIIAFVLIVYLITKIQNYFEKISNHLKAIRIQLEFQNPMFLTSELLQLDYFLKFFHQKMNAYRDDDKKPKELNDLLFKLFWAYQEKANKYRALIAEAKVSGDPVKVYKEYDKWLGENNTEIKNLEDKAKKLDKKIKEILDDRDLSYEFTGKWTAIDI